MRGRSLPTSLLVTKKVKMKNVITVHKTFTCSKRLPKEALGKCVKDVHS